MRAMLKVSSSKSQAEWKKYIADEYRQWAEGDAALEKSPARGQQVADTETKPPVSDSETSLPEPEDAATAISKLMQAIEGKQRESRLRTLDTPLVTSKDRLQALRHQRIFEGEDEWLPSARAIPEPPPIPDWLSATKAA